MSIIQKVLVGISLITGITGGIALGSTPLVVVSTVPPASIIRVYSFSGTVGSDTYNFYIPSTSTTSAENKLVTELQKIITSFPK